MAEEPKKYSSLNSSDLKVIHTYTSDMADAVRDNEMSVIKIALAEKNKREREQMYQEAKGTSLSKIGLLLGGLVLVGIAIFAFYFVSQKNKADNTLPQATKDIETFISYDSKSFVDTTNMESQIDLSNAIKNEMSPTGNPRSIKSIFLTRNVTEKPELLPMNRFISLMELSAPDALTRSLGDSYMVGTYDGLNNKTQTSTENEDTSQTPEILKTKLFLILQIKDYNLAYASMLTWEKTLLNNMFIPFDVDATGDSSNLFEKGWSDIIINNKDARVLYDNIEKPILYYMFLDKNTLVIAKGEDSIKEISTRLLAKKIKPL